MEKISAMTGRTYKPFTYYGAADAERVVVAMGSVTETLKETVDHLTARGEKVGVITVHLYRPFAVKYLLEVLPSTVCRARRRRTCWPPRASGSRCRGSGPYRA